MEEALVDEEVEDSPNKRCVCTSSDESSYNTLMALELARVRARLNSIRIGSFREQGHHNDFDIEQERPIIYVI
jgi:hypothetical protein